MRLSEVESGLNFKLDQDNADLRAEVRKDVNKIDGDIH